MTALDAWTDFLAWWADQVEKAKNLQDKEAQDARVAAAKVGEKQVEATNAMLADRDAIAKASGCASPINCNSQEMKDFRASVENIKGLSPAEQLEFYQRVAYNVYKFDVEPSNGCSNCKAGLSAVLHNLALSTAQGKKNGAKTAEDMWGNSRGFNLNHNQRQQMSDVQKSILSGKKTAGQLRDLLQGDWWQRMMNQLGQSADDTATWILSQYGDYSDDDWKAVANLIGKVSIQVLVGALTAGVSAVFLARLFLIVSAAGRGAALLTILANVGIGGFMTALAQVGNNLYQQYVCGDSKRGMFDNMPSAFGGGAVIGLGSGGLAAGGNALAKEMFKGAAQAYQVANFQSQMNKLSGYATSIGVGGSVIANGVSCN